MKANKVQSHFSKIIDATTLKKDDLSAGIEFGMKVQGEIDQLRNELKAKDKLIYDLRNQNVALANLARNQNTNSQAEEILHQTLSGYESLQKDYRELQEKSHQTGDNYLKLMTGFEVLSMASRSLSEENLAILSQNKDLCSKLEEAKKDINGLHEKLTLAHDNLDEETLNFEGLKAFLFDDNAQQNVELIDSKFITKIIT